MFFNHLNFLNSIIFSETDDIEMFSKHQLFAKDCAR